MSLSSLVSTARRGRVVIPALVVLSIGAAHAQDRPPEHPWGWTDKRAVQSRQFMVAAANPLAVDAGYRMLRAGGSAVDAAIATQLVLGLTEPQSSGLCGGAFLLVHDARAHKLIAYDGRETAPAAATPQQFLDRDGKPLAFTDAVVGGRVDTVRAHPTNPGDITLADLASYRVVVREPVCDRYRRYRICGMPLPSSGGVTVLQILKILEPYDLHAMAPMSFWSIHFFSEAGRLAYADRSVYEADPAFCTPPGGLLDDRYLKARSALITPLRSLGSAAPGDPPEDNARGRRIAWDADHALEYPSTSHISIVDRYGNAVAMTTTIEDAFGSKLMTESGFLLNNELTDFSFVPDENGKPVANRVEGGKRPRSSMAPTIVYDDLGRIYMVAGSPGGSAIINYVAKTLIGVLDWHLDPQAAIALPNDGSRNGPTELETDTPSAVLADKLRALGHNVQVMDHTSGLQAIVRTKNGWIGGADPRREGIVKGD